jgi:4-amino-4-deoxy-L-arabinose transferase-like glycosyltransferase
VRLSRPPLQNWLIAGLAVASGEMTASSVRLPGVIATLLTVALVYWSARCTLSVTGAVVAATAYASFFQVLEQGGTGETEPVFTLFVAASLLLWHGGWLSGRPTTAWTIGGACAGLAMLTKGLQAPLYFFGSTWAYLLVTHVWRTLARRASEGIFDRSWMPSLARQACVAGPLVGLLSFAVIVALWQIPFIAQMGFENGWMIYFRNVAHRFHDDRLSTYAVHFLTYPPAVVCGCLAPWSVLLLAFLSPQVRARLGQRRDAAIFLTTCLAVCLPSVWLPPEARPRYFMPLFPCVAVLIGVAAELLCEQAREHPSRLWTGFVRTAAALLAVAAVALPIASAVFPSSPFVMPLTPAIGIAVALLVIAGIAGGSATTTPTAMQRAALSLAAGLGLIHVGPVITIQQQRSEGLPAAVAELQAQLPPDVRLVSFDHVHHVFLYYFGRNVELLPWPQSADEVPTDVDYFCVQVAGPHAPPLPFAWDEVASLSVDRNYHEMPQVRIVVGRRRFPAGIVRSSGPERR